jgi:L-ascorbate metabolism protein UlaG (beta-lactamase superfamily)
MHVEWYGQSAFRLTDGSTTVFIDPFGDMTPMLDRGMRWDYPAIAGVEADLLLVTHEHVDHNRVEAGRWRPGDVALDRRTPGVADRRGAGHRLRARRGRRHQAWRANTLFVFTLAGRRVAHLGDLGQRAVRDEQLAAASMFRCAPPFRN